MITDKADRNGEVTDALSLSSEEGTHAYLGVV
jgi:hypothetical protein